MGPLEELDLFQQLGLLPIPALQDSNALTT
jgi:hypothetical protein